MTKNYYNGFPEIPYTRTSVEMPFVVAFSKTLVGKYDKEIVRASYCIFRNESANGNSGVNNNYAGIQADNAVWEGLPIENIIGTCVKKDGAGDVRRFICFNDKGYQTCFEFLCYKVNQRGIYIGASGVNNSDDLARSYQEKWVANPKEDTAQARADFKSLYNSSLKAIA